MLNTNLVLAVAASATMVVVCVGAHLVHDAMGLPDDAVLDDALRGALGLFAAAVGAVELYARLNGGRGR